MIDKEPKRDESVLFGGRLLDDLRGEVDFEREKQNASKNK
jgi:hypothetical protein